MNTPRSTAFRFLLLILAFGMSSPFAVTVHAQQVNAGSSAATRGPGGLTVVRNSEYNNVVSWGAVSGANSYTLQHKSLFPANQWTNVPGCNPSSTTCTDITGTSSAYAYRVQASNGGNVTDWSNIAVFLSEPDNDGYVTGPPFSSDSTVPSAIQPGIRAGEGVPGTVNSNIDVRTFLSFRTGLLGVNSTVLGARLRLRQFTNNDAFDLLGPCMVDIETGAFSGSSVLQIGDFYYVDDNTTVDAFEITGVGSDQWFEATVGSTDQVSNIDYTQFRIYFIHSDTINTYAGWYSGESSSNNSEPQLLVRYKE